MSYCNEFSSFYIIVFFIAKRKFLLYSEEFNILSNVDSSKQSFENISY